MKRDFITKDFLEDYQLKRKEFNKKMNELVYGNEIYEKFEEFQSEDAVLFIDPLDATAQFVSGSINAVTVLLGLTVKGIPKIGIIHNPFSTNDPNSVSLTVFGT